jgi:hypothetical protein
MNEQIITNQQFYGGQSSDPAIGTAASFSYGRALEHRRSPSQLTVMPGPREIGQGVITDLILNVVQVENGNRYAFGQDGNIYKVATDNTVTFLKKLASGSDGSLYRSDSDAVYFATQTTVERYYPVSGSPNFDVSYGAYRSIDSNAYRTGGALTYTLKTSISEAATEYCSFQPDIEPFYSMKYNVVDAGSGDWTLTLHDGLNNVLATVTVVAASMKTGIKEFIFSSQIRALVKPNARTYHVHLTSSNGTGTVQTATADDLNTADFQLWAYRLVDTINGLHPMAQFQQFTLIGNGRYLAVWEPLTDRDPPLAEFNPHRLTFPSGFEVCGVAVTDEFAVIACEKRSSDGTKDFQEGKLFLWDGVATTYNQVVDVSGGSPDAITSHENYPYFITNGTLCAWPGGKNIVKVRTLDNTDPAYQDAIDNTRAYPNMMAVRDNLLHIAYPSITTNVDLEHGVHTWGTLEKNYPASWGNLNYVISPQADSASTADTSVQIGCVRNFGDEMYISWKAADGSYGLDIVDSFCDPAHIAKYRARRFDAGAIYKEKKALSMQTVTAALPDGVTITPTSQIDDVSEVVSALTMTTGDSEKIAPIERGRFRRITYGFDVACADNTTPVIYAHSLKWNALGDEKTF